MARPGRRRSTEALVAACVCAGGALLLRTGAPHDTAAAAVAASTAEGLVRSTAAAGRAGSADGAVEPCGAAVRAALVVFQAASVRWQQAADSGVMLPRFRRQAERAESSARSTFDALARRVAGGCPGRWEAVELQLREVARRALLQQRSLIEEGIKEALAAKLLDGMRRQGRPLRVQEKIELLRAALGSYRSQVQGLLPDWAGELPAEEAEVEQRLGRLQFSIEESAGGQALLRAWSEQQVRQLASQRAHGLAISVDPALRVMVRPEGLGNLQVYASGPMPSPRSSGQLSIGIVNDGSLADVYREHPVVPRLSLQPAALVKVKMR